MNALDGGVTTPRKILRTSLKRMQVEIQMAAQRD
jgi:hypothetical protein